MPSRSARDFRLLEATWGRSACAAHRRSRAALQPARRKRAGGRTVPNDMLRRRRIVSLAWIQRLNLSESSETSRSRLSERTSTNVTSRRDLIAAVNGMDLAKIVAITGTRQVNAAVPAHP